VRQAGVTPGQLVVDVGAGRGALTSALEQAGAHVIAVERDPELAAGLRRRFGAAERIEVVEADVRRWSWPDDPFAVVANLPFAAGTAILRSLLADPRMSLRRAHLIVQWELATKRAATWPSTLQGVYWGAWWTLAVVGRLAPAAFSPPPSVSAALLAIERRAPALVPSGEHRAYEAFLRVSWSDRPLRRALRGAVGTRELKRLAADHGFDERALPRDLDARQWAALYARAVSPRRTGASAGRASRSRSFRRR
jgi:23S rRNA (adenine-N6)-dimethyltransferase